MKTIYQLSDENAIGKSKLAKIGGDSSKWTEKKTTEQPSKLSKFWLNLVKMDRIQLEVKTTYQLSDGNATDKSKLVNLDLPTANRPNANCPNFD